ncbi:hypothetical protein C8J57DRAFT_1235577 [Mycena rebaudengoi]|nr:hypothetical protein C8J57DRAFT_1235577 [Mycena rebaudengoi]
MPKTNTELRTSSLGTGGEMMARVKKEIHKSCCAEPQEILSQAQLNENHRQSVHEHYVRRAKQLARRRWDAPKKAKPRSVPEPSPPTPSQLEAPAAAQLKPTGTDSAVGLDYTGFNDEPIVGGGRNSDTEDPERVANAGISPRTAVSQSPEELAAMHGLVLLGQTAVTDDAANSILRRDSVCRKTIYLGLDGYRNSPNMICVSEGHSGGSFLQVDGGILTPNENHGQGVSRPLSLTLMPEIQMEHTIYAGALSRVQAAQLAVAKLNSGALTAPTEDDRASWNARRIRRLRIIKESVLPEPENLRIRGWTVDVDDVLGNCLYWELDSEEEAECRRAEEECRRELNWRHMARRYR